MQPFLVSGLHNLLQHYNVEVLVYAEHTENMELLGIRTDIRLRVFLYHYDPDPFFWDEVQKFNPDIVFCAGWMHRRYMSWCRSLRQKGAQTICAMDTQWKGTFKQKFWAALSPFILKKSFAYAWVPGNRQKEYALKLGFSEDSILNDLYAPDTQLFGQAYFAATRKQVYKYSKKFLYVGRMETHKVLNLVKAFTALGQSELDDWQLHLIGNGALANHPLLKHSSIVYQNALSQQQLVQIAEHGAVFCLCSNDEPWGTVAQEFAAAGLPLVLSIQCGSSEHFLSGNGLLCDGEDLNSIKNALLAFIKMNPQTLFKMSEKSHLLGMATSSRTWAAELMKLV
ncbi:MAG: glycosyltransferase family 4 protein [Phycisphaerales bacterium]|nr:glycosyltransferase family 4 protein [Phycisphaerales bacterium]